MSKFRFTNKHKMIYVSENGNVLFLILIAVALFAALSYAVTSSTRSSGNQGSEETRLISSAQITQFPAAVTNAVFRMIISGVTVEEIRFNRPQADEFDNLQSIEFGVFHPSGGGVSYSPAPADVMADGAPGDWVFNAEMEVPDIGLSGIGGNEIIAFLVGLRKSICLKINEEYGLGAVVPELEGSHSALYTKRMYNDGSSDYEIPEEDVPDIDDGAGTFDGQPFGCFEDRNTGKYVYYHVVLER
ncbi:MAG: hypothetical protein ACLFP8_02520 [Alphaproteobacteria bacterium]